MGIGSDVSLLVMVIVVVMIMVVMIMLVLERVDDMSVIVVVSMALMTCSAEKASELVGREIGNHTS